MKFIATKIIVVVTYRNNKFVAISFTGTLLTYRNKKISCNKFPKGTLLQQKIYCKKNYYCNKYFVVINYSNNIFFCNKLFSK